MDPTTGINKKKKSAEVVFADQPHGAENDFNDCSWKAWSLSETQASPT